jgi:hypothetical protein
MICASSTVCARDRTRVPSRHQEFALAPGLLQLAEDERWPVGEPEHVQGHLAGVTERHQGVPKAVTEVRRLVRGRTENLDLSVEFDPDALPTARPLPVSRPDTAGCRGTAGCRWALGFIEPQTQGQPTKDGSTRPIRASTLQSLR